MFFQLPIAALTDGLQSVYSVLVHFSLTLLSAGLLVDLLGHALERLSPLDVGWWWFVLGVVTAVVSGFARLQAQEAVSLRQEDHGVLGNHEPRQTCSAVVLTGLLIWRGIKRGTGPKPAVACLVVSAIAHHRRSKPEILPTCPLLPAQAG